MTPSEPVQRVRIYLSERDTSQGQPLYLLTLERLRREGATGATALRGIAGFGADRRVRTAGMAEFSQAAPIVIEWVDRADRVARVLPSLDDLLPEALITVEDLRVYRAVLRSGGPFGGRSVGEALLRDAAAVSPGAPLTAAAEELLRSHQPLLPVVDDAGQVVGVLGDALLERHAAPLRLLAALPPPERAALLAELPSRAVGEAVAADPRTIYIETTIAQTVSVLVEWGLDSLPVLDRDGRLAGLFGVEQALRAALERRPAAGNVRDAEPPPPISLIMQMLLPTIPATAPLHTALTQLLAAQGRFLVVMNGWTPLGTLTDAQVATQLPDTLRPLWLAALRGQAQITQQAVEEAAPAVTAGSVALTPAPLVKTRETQDDAIRLALEGGHERLVVVDDEGRLAGLVTRRGLLRALAQESGS
jgi:PII-like signaling protein/predicted transcriptional regulator